MGIFGHKQQQAKTADETAAETEQHFFDEYFQEELRNHGRWYFEKIINENGALFKQDLDSTVEQVRTELKDHITSQLDTAVAQLSTELKDHVVKQLEERFAGYDKSAKEIQEKALHDIAASTQSMQEQHQQLLATLQKSISDQDSLLHNTFEENKTNIAAMKEAQDSALEWLRHSAQALQDQYQQISTTLQKNVSDQEAMLISAFEANMAQIVEHYLTSALGEQYDMKSQMPAIIKQMEANKQAIKEDMNL